MYILNIQTVHPHKMKPDSNTMLKNKTIVTIFPCKSKQTFLKNLLSNLENFMQNYCNMQEVKAKQKAQNKELEIFYHNSSKMFFCFWINCFGFQRRSFSSATTPSNLDIFRMRVGGGFTVSR